MDRRERRPAVAALADGDQFDAASVGTAGRRDRQRAVDPIGWVPRNGSCRARTRRLPVSADHRRIRIRGSRRSG